MKKAVGEEMFKYIGLTNSRGLGNTAKGEKEKKKGITKSSPQYQTNSRGETSTPEFEREIYHEPTTFPDIEPDIHLPSISRTTSIFTNPFAIHLPQSPSPPISNSTPTTMSPPSPQKYTSHPPQTLTFPPPPHPSFTLTYPTPQILLVTISRPAQMNALPLSAHWEGDALFSWYDSEPSLRVAIITGSGEKAFCAGQDLASLVGGEGGGDGEEGNRGSEREKGMPKSGFAGLSRRKGKKPVIAAVNGFALGGGFEIVLNCDITLATPHSTFSLPEPLIGLYAAAGGLPRLTATLGLPLASEIALTSRRLTALEALSYHLINRVSATQESLLDEAVEMAGRVLGGSPDAIVATRAGLREILDGGREGETEDVFLEKVLGGENFRRGVEGFLGKKKGGARWVDSKL